ncbi:MAG: hypothetical protein LBE27_00525 [Deltaproteobacteria bacterium]|jgi:cell shape-determining protein MreD|nr:hypothetical protein [Deltaproteobacteria bacterium]
MSYGASRTRVHERPSPGGVVLVMALGLILNFFYAAFKARFSGLVYFPDILILLTLWVALRTDLFISTLSLFILGFFLDSLSLAPPGIMPLNLVLLAFVVNLLSRVLEFASNFYIMCLSFFIFSLSNLAIYPLLIYISYGNLPFDVISHYFSIYCAQGVLTALAAPVAFWFLDGLTARGD